VVNIGLLVAKRKDSDAFSQISTFQPMSTSFLLFSIPVPENEEAIINQVEQSSEASILTPERTRFNQLREEGGIKVHGGSETCSEEEEEGGGEEGEEMVGGNEDEMRGGSILIVEEKEREDLEPEEDEYEVDSIQESGDFYDLRLLEKISLQLERVESLCLENQGRLGDLEEQMKILTEDQNSIKRKEQNRRKRRPAPPPPNKSKVNN